MMKKLKKEHEDEKNERLVDFNLKSKTLNTPGDAKLGKFQALIGWEEQAYTSSGKHIWWEDVWKKHA